MGYFLIHLLFLIDFFFQWVFFHLQAHLISLQLNSRHFTGLNNGSVFSSKLKSDTYTSHVVHFFLDLIEFYLTFSSHSVIFTCLPGKKI